jgi:hypothetical protein
MAFPSKFTSFDSSILSKISYLMFDDKIEISLSELMQLKINKFDDVSEFMLALDVLYALKKIELDKEKGLIKYVG